MASGGAGGQRWRRRRARTPFAAKLHERISSSLWIAPGTAAVVAMVAAKAFAGVDRWFAPELRAWYLFGAHAAGGRELLATIANSLLTFTGVVFSITILVLQLASSQYSPRVLRTFLRDRSTRTALAVFVGTLVYAMALLPEVRGGPAYAEEFVPRLAISVAFALALVSVAVFIRYLHNMAHAIRAVHIINRVAQETRETIEEFFPEGEVNESEANEPGPSLPRSAREVSWNRDAGVLSVVDAATLVDIAAERDGVIEVMAEAGDFIPRGAPIVRIFPDMHGRDAEILGCLYVAEERTAEQDPAFGFRQLVDIAERALSPSTNDPTTAVQALDQIHDLLRSLARRRFPPGHFSDEAGHVRVVLPRPGWEAFVHLGLDEIRQYGRGSLQILRRLRAVIDDLLTVVPPQRRAPLVRQLELLDQARARGLDSEGERRLAGSGDRQNA
jgi:uncharacterized membrane protein